MKDQITRWAWCQSLSPSQKLVLLALAEAADEHGVCSPSISALAIQCQLSSRTVQRVINALLNVGRLERTRRQREDGSSISNQYRLMVHGGDAGSEVPSNQVSVGCQPRQTGSELAGTLSMTTTAAPSPSGSLGARDSHAATQPRSDIENILQQILVRLTVAIEQGNIPAALLGFLHSLIEQTHVNPLMQVSSAANQTRAITATEISRAFADDPLPSSVAGSHLREIQPSAKSESSKVISTTNSDEPADSTYADGTLRRRPLFPELARVIG